MLFSRLLLSPKKRNKRGLLRIKLLVYTRLKKHILPLGQGEGVLLVLDKFLKGSKMANVCLSGNSGKANVVYKIDVECDESDGVTSCRIAQAIVNTLQLVCQSLR